MENKSVSSWSLNFWRFQEKLFFSDCAWSSLGNIGKSCKTIINFLCDSRSRIFHRALFFKKNQSVRREIIQIACVLPSSRFSLSTSDIFSLFCGKTVLPFLLFLGRSLLRISSSSSSPLHFQDRHRRKERKRKTHQVFLLSHIFSLLVFFSVDSCLLLKGL